MRFNFRVSCIFFALMLLLSTFAVQAQNIWDGYEYLLEPVKEKVVYRTTMPITIDGRADEESWQLTKWSDYFVDIFGKNMPDSLLHTRCKVLWDEETLYIFTELLETDLWTAYSKPDEAFGEENSFQIFIDPDKDTHDYFEFELNAHNRRTDRFMSKPRRNGGIPLWDWNIKGFKSAVTFAGTLNNPEDMDEKWNIEIAIPFKSLTIRDEYTKPEDGDYWKVNFARVQWYANIVNGVYEKIEGKENRDYFVWSPQYVENMHFPEQWGVIHFSATAAGTQEVAPPTPTAEKYADYLWMLYYRQMLYRKKHLQYAKNLSDMGFSQVAQTREGETFLYSMDVKGDLLMLYLTTQDKVKLAINQDGHFSLVNE